MKVLPLSEAKNNYRVTVKEIEVVAVGPRRTIHKETTRLMK
jgi:hypothetical protein